MGIRRFKRADAVHPEDNWTDRQERRKEAGHGTGQPDETVGWVDREIADTERELEERSLPLRLRDSRASSDDGYEDYLTEAEEAARSVRVAATKEKLRILRDCRDILEESGKHDN